MLPGITSESIDQVISQEPAEAVLSTLNDSDNEEEMHEESRCRTSTCRTRRTTAKGMAVHFTHQNWELVVNIMMGHPQGGGQVMRTEPPAVQERLRREGEDDIVNRVAAGAGQSAEHLSASRLRTHGVPQAA